MSRPRVLVVDDMAFEWEAAIKKLGPHCLLSRQRSGEAALKELLHNSGDYDVLIVDYSMSNGNGFWLVAKMVQHKLEIPVLVNSQHSRGKADMLALLRRAGVPCGTTRLTGSFGDPWLDVQALLLLGDESIGAQVSQNQEG